ncbi:MAG: signal peptidase I [Polyangiales bacterium]
MTSQTLAQESGWERTKANIKTIVGAVLLATFIRIVLFEAFEIEGPSMEPTLLNGDRVVVAKFAYGLFLPFSSRALIRWGRPDLGDVVIVKSPADGIDIVKRVVGLPGDRIEVREHLLYRNGRAVQHADLGACTDAIDRVDAEDAGCTWLEEQVGERRYLTSHSIDSHALATPFVQVPPGHVFVLGDHRDRSNDSRYFGAVPMARLKGKALAIYWSNDRRIRWARLGATVH